MDLHSASTPRRSSAVVSSDAQENKEPVHVGIAAKTVVAASTAPAKANGSSNAQKLRRALHSIDSNRPRSVSCPPVHSPNRDLPNDPFCVVQTPVEAQKHSNSVHTSKDAVKAPETQLTGRKRAATTGHNECKTPTDSSEQCGLQKSENLAWMDMILALLEKKYGAKSSLPVCLTDLEKANVLQLPHKKKRKTGIAGSKQLSNSLNVSTQSSEAINTNKEVTNLQQIPARVEGEQDKDKRQRLLRHAQQIQASSVSSSTSCGCKTGCLKMYCMCFSSRGFCHAGCGCDDCKNGRTNQTERVEAIQNYLANDPRAFSFASAPQDASTTGFLHLLPQKSSAVVMRGCRCKKSKCLKKYCECFQNGIACTSHCRCMDCSNHCDSTAAHQHPHLQKGSATVSDKGSRSDLFISPAAEPKPFHAVQITVTKQPRRNHVGKTLRLNL